MRRAVISVRSGSKRIPRKSIKPFCGKPMIAWLIEATLQSRCFDQVVVSTDNAEIADVARQHGADVPFMRPAELYDVHTGTIPVIHHAIERFTQQGGAVEQVYCLSAEDLNRGVQVLQSNDCDYAFSATSYAFPIQRAIRINGQGRAEMFNSEYFNTRFQVLEEAFHDTAMMATIEKSLL